MHDFIKTNSNLLRIKINKIIEKSKIINKKNKCNICNKLFNNIYDYDNKLIIKESAIHQLISHYQININLYEKISKIEIPLCNIIYNLINTNNLSIIDGLYEEGSKKIYIENKKNIFNSKINRFSEHSGLLYFNNNKLDKITILNESRVGKGDPLIYLPHNNLEALLVDYLFHTHPKTPFIGSRSIDGIIYEFPSISDLLHFIEHHNSGKLLGSIIITPEGIYIIHKLNFDREKIKIDYDLFLNEIEEVYTKSFRSILENYKNFKEILPNKKSKLNFFYNKIANNFEYITFINNCLTKYDIYIDYFPRIKLKDKDFVWIFPNIYLPIIL